MPGVAVGADHRDDLALTCSEHERGGIVARVDHDDLVVVADDPGVGGAFHCVDPSVHRPAHVTATFHQLQPTRRGAGRTLGRVPRDTIVRAGTNPTSGRPPPPPTPTPTRRPHYATRGPRTHEPDAHGGHPPPNRQTDWRTDNANAPARRTDASVTGLVPVAWPIERTSVAAVGAVPRCRSGSRSARRDRRCTPRTPPGPEPKSARSPSNWRNPFPFILLRVVDLDPGQADRGQVGDHIVRDLPPPRRAAGMGGELAVTPWPRVTSRMASRRVQCVPGDVSAAGAEIHSGRERLVRCSTATTPALDHRLPLAVCGLPTTPPAAISPTQLPGHWHAKSGQLVDHGAGRCSLILPDLFCQFSPASAVVLRVEQVRQHVDAAGPSIFLSRDSSVPGSSVRPARQRRLAASRWPAHGVVIGQRG